MEGLRNVGVALTDSFWSNNAAISSRSRQKGLQYAMEGYIHSIKIRKEGGTTSIEALAYRSQCKSEKPHGLYVKFDEHNIVDQACSCTAGQTLGTNKYKLMKEMTDAPISYLAAEDTPEVEVCGKTYAVGCGLSHQ
ncbi:hypothetical protein NQZ68_040170 [Dissostichus eleginoides]|nr:hypothetical protein NQZ68_040170 [Dissostichus eleginoides]